jgi:lipopolysaccharide export system protein LptA
VLWLLDQATMKMAPDEKGGGAAEGSAKAAGLARADHYVRLTENAHVVSDNRTLDSIELTIQLSDDDKLIRSVTMRGNSRITGGTGAEGMSARDIDLTYGADGRALQSARLMEGAEVQLAGAGGSGARKVAAQTMDLGFGADGSTVTRLDATQNVQVDLPATADMPARRINSTSLNASGPNGLQSATFSGGVIYREIRAAQRGEAPAAERTGRSQRLIVETQPGFGNIQRADFRSNVHIEDGANVVEGARVIYRVAQDSFDLAPSAEDTGPPPTVNDGRVLVQARTITFTVGTKKLVADTDVRSSMQPQGKSATAPTAARGNGRGRGGTAGETSKLPSVLKQSEPVQITANHLEYDGAAALAKYTGAAKLWQDKTRIQGDAIDLDDRNANLTARGHVASVMFLEETDTKTKTTKLVESTATADMLVYEDAKRLATYTTGETAKAHLVGTQGDLTGDVIKLFFQESTNELDRAEADGHVVLKDRNRTATGNHLTYTPKNETYVMTGSPVEVEERIGNECRLAQASSLTFDKTSDRMLMENNKSAPVKWTQCTAK